MILTRTPLRISIGGGGTDLPSYYREFGGFVISAAIAKYIYIGVNRNFFPGYVLKYSNTEYASSRGAIRHLLTREALLSMDIQDDLEITSVADVPGGTGLGSSGSFLVGLLHALHAYRGTGATAAGLAARAARIEMETLGQPVGKQDQYAAAYGGLLCQEYHRDDGVSVSPLRMSVESIERLQNSLALFFVGQTRSSSLLLEDQKRKSEQRDPGMIESLRFTKRLGFEIRALLEAGDVDLYGALMHEHWLRKRERSPGISTSLIDEAYECARREGGATGGKLVGAGGGGFLLVQTTDRERLRQAMAKTGMKEMDFRFDFRGSIVAFQDPGTGRPESGLAG